jgi:4-hydroxy-tetrahydrodipicolinate reductase
MMKIAIAGATGRMGRMLIETVLNTPDAQLVGALEHSTCPLLGEDAGAFLGKKTGVMISADVAQVLSSAQFLIDFTRPEGTMAHLAVAEKTATKMVIGTTGLNAEQLANLKRASATLAIVFAPNMSVGVNVTFKLLEIAAKMLNEGYDIEIIEAHHRHKVDAPSGTALKMGEVIAGALGEKLDDVAV